MNNYLDGTYAVVDGVLLSYFGNDISLNIPGHFADMSVRKIGQGSFMESQNLQQVFIPETVKAIGANAFSGCTNLNTVFLPGTIDFARFAFDSCPGLVNINFYNLEVSKSEYNNLKSSSAKFDKSQYLVHSFPYFRQIRDALIAVRVKPANLVPVGTKLLFTSQTLDKNDENRSITQILNCIDFCGDSSYSTELESYEKLLTSDRDFSTDPISEKANDDIARIDKVPPITKTAIFTFDDKKTKENNGRFYLSANIRIGYHFCHSVVPVFYGQKQYNIFQRHYLSGETNLNYIRIDTALFSKNKLIKSREEALPVYAKYRFLSLL